MTSILYEGEKLTPKQSVINVSVVLNPNTIASASTNRPNSAFFTVTFKHYFAVGSEQGRKLRQAKDLRDSLTLEAAMDGLWCETVRFPQFFSEGGKRVLTSMVPLPDAEERPQDHRSSKVLHKGMLFKGTMPAVSGEGKRKRTGVKSDDGKEEELLLESVTVVLKYHSHVLIPQTQRPDPALAKQVYLGLPLLGARSIRSQSSVSLDLQLTIPITSGVYSAFAADLLLRDQTAAKGDSDGDLLGCLLVEKRSQNEHQAATSAAFKTSIEPSLTIKNKADEFEQKERTKVEDPSELVGGSLVFCFQDVFLSMSKSRREIKTAEEESELDTKEHFLIIGDAALNDDSAQRQLKTLGKQSTLTLLMKKPWFIALAVVWIAFWFRGAAKMFLPAADRGAMTSSGGAYLENEAVVSGTALENEG